MRIATTAAAGAVITSSRMISIATSTRTLDSSWNSAMHAASTRASTPAPRSAGLALQVGVAVADLTRDRGEVVLLLRGDRVGAASATSALVKVCARSRLRPARPGRVGRTELAAQAFMTRTVGRVSRFHDLAEEPLLHAGDAVEQQRIGGLRPVDRREASSDPDGERATANPARWAWRARSPRVAITNGGARGRRRRPHPRGEHGVVHAAGALCDEVVEQVEHLPAVGDEVVRPVDAADGELGDVQRLVAHPRVGGDGGVCRRPTQPRS